MGSFRITVTDNTQFSEILTALKNEVRNSCTDIANDVLYVSRGAAPFKTGNLEKSISMSTRSSGDKFEAEIGVSAFEKGFDYGALRHDEPFNLGPGSVAKGGVNSNITGNYSAVGYNFAGGTAEQNADDYVKFLEENISNVLDNF